MSIRRSYVDLIKRIAANERVDLRFGPSSVYVVPAAASRTHCLRYALRHVSGDTTPHYRYNKYRGQLVRALHMNAARMQTHRPLLHLDLGCGPGLFTWVVHDTLSRSDYPAVRYFGYDHCRNMVALADEIWSRLATARTPPGTTNGDPSSTAYPSTPRPTDLLSSPSATSWPKPTISPTPPTLSPNSSPALSPPTRSSSPMTPLAHLSLSVPDVKPCFARCVLAQTHLARNRP